jgi:hypothetical protein
MAVCCAVTGRAIQLAGARAPGQDAGAGVREQAGPARRHERRRPHRVAQPAQHKGPRLAHPGVVRGFWCAHGQTQAASCAASPQRRAARPPRRDRRFQGLGC